MATLFILGACRYNQNTPTQSKEEKTFTLKDHVYQYSIIDALLSGVYDGNLTAGELKLHGDFGIGTFNGLDGEMMVKDGKVFKMRYNGEVVEVDDSIKTPLAFVKFFEVDTTLTIKGNPITYDTLKLHLAPFINENKMYAIRIKGKFDQIEARSVSPVTKPYPDLATHIATGGQTSFTFQNTDGTLSGFISPQFTARANIPGYHLHYLDNDHKNGGHVFDFKINQITVEIDRVKGFSVELNTNKDFDSANLNKNRDQELKKVEQKD